MSGYRIDKKMSGYVLIVRRLLLYTAAALLLAGCFRIQNTKIRDRLMPVNGALEQYAADNSAYPEDLAMLIPRYLDSLPVLSKPYDYRIHGRYYLLYLQYWKS